MTEQAEDEEIVTAVTRVVRKSDGNFEKSGGGSRHWVRDCFLPELNRAGLKIGVAVPASPELAAVTAERDAADQQVRDLANHAAELENESIRQREALVKEHAEDTAGLKAELERLTRHCDEIDRGWGYQAKRADAAEADCSELRQAVFASDSACASQIQRADAAESEAKRLRGALGQALEHVQQASVDWADPHPGRTAETRGASVGMHVAEAWRVIRSALAHTANEDWEVRTVFQQEGIPPIPFSGPVTKMEPRPPPVWTVKETPAEHFRRCGPMCAHVKMCLACINVFGLCTEHRDNPDGTWTWTWTWSEAATTNPPEGVRMDWAGTTGVCATSTGLDDAPIDRDLCVHGRAGCDQCFAAWSRKERELRDAVAAARAEEREECAKLAGTTGISATSTEPVEVEPDFAPGPTLDWEERQRVAAARREAFEEAARIVADEDCEEPGCTSAVCKMFRGLAAAIRALNSGALTL